MVPQAPALPVPRDTVHLDDVVAIERWAAAQQAQLRLLQRELQTAQADARSALLALEASPSALPNPGTELAPQLTAVRTALARRLEADIEAARAESRSMLSEAVREATELLLSVGVDPVTITQITASEPATATAPASTAAAVVDLTTESRQPSAGDDPAFDRFWGGSFEDRPMRDRFSRWVQRQEQ